MHGDQRQRLARVEATREIELELRVLVPPTCTILTVSVPGPGSTALSCMALSGTPASAAAASTTAASTTEVSIVASRACASRVGSTSGSVPASSSGRVAASSPATGSGTWFQASSAELRAQPASTANATASLLAVMTLSSARNVAGK